jgi:hypothetical protein
MELLLGFLSGMFLVNSIPHLVTGINGKSHMTPFAKNSSAMVNVIWAFINIIVGIWILVYSQHGITDVFAFDNFSWSFWGGALFMALGCAWLFGNKNARFPWFK